MWSWQPKKWPKRSKYREKMPYHGYFWAIGIALWRRDSYNINIYWHPWFGPILSTFGCLEVPFADNSSLVWPGVSEVPAPLASKLSLTDFMSLWPKNIHILHSYWLHGLLLLMLDLLPQVEIIFLEKIHLFCFFERNIQKQMDFLNMFSPAESSI